MPTSVNDVEVRAVFQRAAEPQTKRVMVAAIRSIFPRHFRRRKIGAITGSVYRTLQRLAGVRRDQPALRYGRQYFRPLSGDGFHFGNSSFSAGVLAFSRILNDQELIVVANSNTQSGFTGEVIVDFSLNPAGSAYDVLFTNKTAQSGSGGAGGVAPGPVLEKAAGNVEIH